MNRCFGQGQELYHKWRKVFDYNFPVDRSPSLGARRRARAVFDNPRERLAQVIMAVTRVLPSARSARSLLPQTMGRHENAVKLAGGLQIGANDLVNNLVNRSGLDPQAPPNRHPLEDLETDRFLLRPPKLVELARCAHPSTLAARSRLIATAR